jgi:uncharacterized membrane protein YedE/YeeE
MMNHLATLLCGILFGSGLALSGMTNTHLVIGFLDVFGNWQSALAFVMGGAILVTLPGYRLVMKRKGPLCEADFSLPTNRKIDGKLIAGACLFGIGWGLYGYCPGPAIASLVYLNVDTVLFVAAMLLGIVLERKLVSR